MQEKLIKAAEDLGRAIKAFREIKAGNQSDKMIRVADLALVQAMQKIGEVIDEVNKNAVQK